MSVHYSNAKEGIDLPTNGETQARIIPNTWAEQGTRPNLDDTETQYYAVRYVVEHELADDPDVLAGRSDGRGETVTLHVQYVRGDAARAIEASFPACVIETGDGVLVEPEDLSAGGWPASLAVDGTQHEIASIERGTETVRALEALHGLEVTA